MYRTLQAEKIIDTTRKLRSRVQERFPDSSLLKVTQELVAIAEEASARCRSFRTPNLGLRVMVTAFLLSGVTAIILLFTQVHISESMWNIENFLEEFNAALGIVVFIGMAVAFLMTLEIRIKRRRVLNAINELRALAHIVDMHQLTKDPEFILRTGPSTPSSPIRNMSSFELSRYFDYCSELLALTAKIAALYVQDFPDPVVLNAVDDVEEVTSNLSHKIWQKITLLDRFAEREEELNRLRGATTGGNS
ncbi:MAG: hypothetical protein ACKVX7_06850 [Planctomycetota bacterium]